MGNPDELHRLVVNLLENARPPHALGELRSSSRSRRSTGGRVLEVSDDGPGIPEGIGDADLRALRARRWPRGRDAPAPARGLGLAIVRAVARSHGGEVTAGRSEAGGARFAVSLPLAGAPIAQASSS